MTLASNYHIQVNPSDAGIYDRVVVMELIKNAAQTHQLDSTGQREFKGSLQPQIIVKLPLSLGLLGYALITLMVVAFVQ